MRALALRNQQQVLRIGGFLVCYKTLAARPAAQRVRLLLIGFRSAAGRIASLRSPLIGIRSCSLVSRCG